MTNLVSTRWKKLQILKKDNMIHNTITVTDAISLFPKELITLLKSRGKLWRFVWYFNHDKRMELCRQNDQEPHVDIIKYDTTPAITLMSAFCWNDTGEGFDYWANMFNKLNQNEYWGPEPKLVYKKIKNNEKRSSKH